MITVHHLNASRSLRILWMLEELGVPYEIKHYRRLPSMQAPPELRAVHPLGKSPVITDGGRTLAESGAILEYLIDAYGNGRLRPAAGTPEHHRYTYFLHYAEGSLMPLLVMKLIFSRIPSRVPFLLRPVARMISGGADKTQILNHLAFLENELKQRDWFAGNEFTAADIQMSFPLEAAAARVGFADRLSRLEGFVDRIKSRPAYKRAEEKSGAHAPLR
jgi:glutathione S-transferase